MTDVERNEWLTDPFPPEVFRARRQRLMKKLGSGIAVIFAADQSGRGELNADFLYLTGLYDEPGAILLLAPAQRAIHEYLFLAPRDPDQERWTGDRLPLGRALEQRTGLQRVRRTSSFGWALTEILPQVAELHFLGPLVSPEANVPKVLELYAKLVTRSPGLKIINNAHQLPRMRTVKDSSEIEAVRTAVEVTMQGLFIAMKSARAGMTEAELKDQIEAGLRRGGAQATAFPTIVGSGHNGAILHHKTSNRQLHEGELVLCDIGATVNRYSADLTRTFPVSGTFLASQKNLYEVVLNAQTAVRINLRAGVFHDELQGVADLVIAEAGYPDKFTHTIGHFIGLNVHDVGNYYEALPAGSILTVEPGLYLRESGIGIRIEDNFIVKEGGYDCISMALPVSPDEIEQTMGM
jgi:Xaa-Pro aminopeptidase